MDVDSVNIPGSWKDGVPMDRMDIDDSLASLVSVVPCKMERESLNQCIGREIQQCRHRLECP